MTRFKATLEPAGRGGHVVAVPPKVAEAAGLANRARVRGTFGGAEYRSSLAVYSGVLYLGIHKATVTAAGVKLGAKVDVTIEADDAPRPTDTVPTDLKKALKASKRASTAWATLAPSHRREHVKHVLDAKQPETRARRIAKTIDMLAAAKQPTRP
jgi:hypothetical protein